MRASRVVIAVASLLGVVLVACLPRAARAQETQDAASRRVKGHVFTVPMLQDSAFVTTHVGIREGFALYDVPDLPVSVLGTRDVQLSGFQQSLDLGLAITDWLGVYGFGRALAYAGVDRTSLIVDGATVSFSVSGGAIARLFKSDSTGTQVSLRARFAYTKRQDITFEPVIQQLIDTTSDTLADVVEGRIGHLVYVPVSETSLAGGAYAAQYITRFLSAQASATLDSAWQTRKPFILELDERASEEGDSLVLRLAAAVELDFTHLFAPVSLMAEYLFAHGSRDETGPDVDLGSSDLGLGIYYVGRPNLQLGIGAVTSLGAEPRRGIDENGEPALSGDPSLTYVDLVLRYIW